MSLDIVDHDYMLDLGEFKDDKAVRHRIVFLLNAVKVLYCAIKDHMQEWAADNGTTFNYILELDNNTTMYLDKAKNKRIGIRLDRVTTFTNTTAQQKSPSLCSTSHTE